MTSSELVAPVLEEPPEIAAGAGAPKRTRPLHDLLGVAWVVVAAFVVMVPALRPGVSLGPFDLLTRFGLTFHAGAPVHNAIQADQIEQFVPWTYLAWHQVHSGVLPLWEPYNVLGTPLAFNWQSAVFSLPMALGYLFPVHFAYTVVVLTKLLIAGTGAYVLCRVLGLGALASAFGGSVFELSGPIVVHSGWSMTGVTVWSGWLLAAALLVLRSPRPWRHTVWLALVVALAVYGGHPESLVVVAISAAVFVAVVVAARGVGDRVAARSALLVVGACLGFGLGAPLLMPGLQLGFASTRGSGVGASAFPVTHLPNLLVAGLQGDDFRTAAYVGVITLVVATAGARVAWRRAEVRALVVLGVLCLLLTYVSPLDDLLHKVPGARAVDWGRAVMVLALTLAVLAAVGVDALWKRRAGDPEPTMDRWVRWGLAAGAVVVFVVALWGLLGVSQSIKDNLIRLVAPVAELIVGALVLWLPGRGGLAHRWQATVSAMGRRAAPILLLTETTVLVVSGVSFWSVSHGYFPTTSGTTSLEAKVGGALVGLGTCGHVAYVTPSTQEVGIRADANIAYGVEEFAVYDPILQGSYFKLWQSVSRVRVPKALSQLGVFCARITNVTEARLFGIGYVLEPRDRHGPLGAVPDGTVGDEKLFRIPASSRATLSEPPESGRSLSIYAPGTPVRIEQPEDGTWKMTVDTSGPEILRLRLTAVPGWRATIDGRPLTLTTWADHTMLEARVPPGRHEVEVRYWPRLFSVGLVVAICAAFVCLVMPAVVVVTGLRRHRRVSGAPT